MSNKKGIFRNIASLGIVQIANNVLPLISIPIISRIIGPDKLGIINFDFSIVAYFTLFIGYGFDLTATRKIARDPNNVPNRNSVFSEVLYSQCLLFIISVIFFAIILFQLPLLATNKLVAIFSFAYCISSVLTQNWLFQAMQDLPKVAIFNLLSKLSFTIAVLLLIHKKDDYYWHPVCLSIIQIAVASLSFLWAIKKYNISLIKVSLKSCFELLWAEKTVFFSMTIIILYTTTNTIILGMYKSVDQVGYYTAGQKLIYVVNTIVTIPLSLAMFPYIGKAFASSKDQGLKIAQKLIPFVFIVTGLGTICMFTIGPSFLLLFYGQKFEPSIPVFKILAIVPMLLCINNILGVQIMLNLKMDRYYFRVNAGAALLSLLLNFVMIKHWGYIGSAINWLTVESFNSICMFCVLRYNGINPIEPKYWKFKILKEFLVLIRKPKEI